MGSTAVDLKKPLAGYRARSGRFDVVEVLPLRYLMIDGGGEPNIAPAFTATIDALYSRLRVCFREALTEMARVINAMAEAANNLDTTEPTRHLPDKAPTGIKVRPIHPTRSVSPRRRYTADGLEVEVAGTSGERIVTPRSFT